MEKSDGKEGQVFFKFDMRLLRVLFNQNSFSPPGKVQKCGSTQVSKSKSQKSASSKLASAKERKMATMR